MQKLWGEFSNNDLQINAKIPFMGVVLSKGAITIVIIILVSYFEERPWWPIQRLNKGRKKKEKGKEEKKIRSSLLILDLKDGKLKDSGKQEEGKTFHILHVLGMNDYLWVREFVD